MKRAEERNNRGRREEAIGTKDRIDNRWKARRIIKKNKLKIYPFKVASLFTLVKTHISKPT